MGEPLAVSLLCGTGAPLQELIGYPVSVQSAMVDRRLAASMPSSKIARLALPPINPAA
jgi:hypothetical protein